MVKYLKFYSHHYWSIKRVSYPHPAIDAADMQGRRRYIYL